MSSPAPALKRMKHFCAVLSHDLNNYSGIIQGYVELLRLELEPGSECLGYLDRILQACGKINDRSRTFETFAETRSLALMSFEISDLLGQEAARDPRVSFAIEGEPLPIRAHPDTLRVAIRELLDNALEACQEQAVQMRYFQEGDGMILEIANPCSGIDEADREALFDPYFSRRGRGRGLGLARVHGILSLHNATVQVDFDHFGRIVFRLSFPLSLNG